ncbi:MAG: hypothetical protein QME74_01595 [Candidatus Edwardsbacteria bacterium]|nr:hypothetical protein [Candidatus Edwardsbacteria bacterium]
MYYDTLRQVYPARGGGSGQVLRQKTGEERLLLGMELYEIAFKAMQDGISHKHPGWDAQQIRAETAKRFSRACTLAR